MSDLTGIDQTTKILRKDTVQKFVPDAAPPETAVPRTSFTGGGFTSGFVTGSPTTGNYIQGVNQWGQTVLVYRPPEATAINVTIG